jgi:hypothetical protein
METSLKLEKLFQNRLLDSRTGTGWENRTPTGTVFISFISYTAYSQRLEGQDKNPIFGPARRTSGTQKRLAAAG